MFLCLKFDFIIFNICFLVFFMFYFVCFCILNDILLLFCCFISDKINKSLKNCKKFNENWNLIYNLGLKSNTKI